ncbi:thiol:disulfide interchange protein DsbA [Sphaerotilus hippei]|uniref:Thiol:disulfide interchange protein DsbA n=1 Tax=Sphaerotilus hippei TaxID=744406 RepID=A0A318HGT1_9BURK|nr:thiol:disulfide interchange protein DsbA/DsbL [Sphaerotilus hippei]PXW99253.1 thiol:disulfide interchange protein DsbA [Sphaerotilus hippei]
MDRRAFIAQGSALLVAGGAAGAASAQAVFQEGRHYVRLPQSVAVSVPAGKIEVVEFFWYGCPHCNAFEPTLEAWVKKLPADVVFRRVHVGFRPSFEPQQRLALTLETMGLMDSLQRKVFHRIHVEGERLDRPEAIIAWAVANGVDEAKFKEIFNSFGMANRVRQSSKLAEAYKIEGVPALGVHGRFYTSPALAGGDNAPEAVGHGRALQLVDQLILRARKGT